MRVRSSSRGDKMNTDHDVLKLILYSEIIANGIHV